MTNRPRTRRRDVADKKITGWFWYLGDLRAMLEEANERPDRDRLYLNAEDPERPLLRFLGVENEAAAEGDGDPPPYNYAHPCPGNFGCPPPGGGG